MKTLLSQLKRKKMKKGKSSRNSEIEEKLVFVSANGSERNQCESKMMTI